MFGAAAVLRAACACGDNNRRRSFIVADPPCITLVSHPNSGRAPVPVSEEYPLEGILSMPLQEEENLECSQLYLSLGPVQSKRVAQRHAFFPQRVAPAGRWRSPVHSG